MWKLDGNHENKETRDVDPLERLAVEGQGHVGLGIVTEQGLDRAALNALRDHA